MSWSSFFKIHMESLDDEDLSGEEVVKKFLDGECDFQLVLAKYSNLLFNKAHKQYVPGYNAEELFQELMVKTFITCKKWDKQENTKFGTYLFHALDNHLNYLRRREGAAVRTLNHESVSYDILLDQNDDRTTGGFFEKQYGKLPSYEMPTLFCDLIEDDAPLSVRERICVEMIFEGHGNNEIAERLSLSRVRISQIVKSLRPKLNFLITSQ
jgi:RNA polymerase sigma factor (sigma-70 family)